MTTIGPDEAAPLMYAELQELRRVLADTKADAERQRAKAEDFEGRYETSHSSRMWAEECYRRELARADATEAALVAARAENTELSADVQLLVTTKTCDRCGLNLAINNTVDWADIIAAARRDGATEALNAVESIVKFEAGAGDVYMRADVLVAIRQARASVLATTSEPGVRIANGGKRYCGECGFLLQGNRCAPAGDCSGPLIRQPFIRQPIGATTSEPQLEHVGDWPIVVDAETWNCTEPDCTCGATPSTEEPNTDERNEG